MEHSVPEWLVFVTSLFIIGLKLILNNTEWATSLLLTNKTTKGQLPSGGRQGPEKVHPFECGKKINKSLFYNTLFLNVIKNNIVWASASFFKSTTLLVWGTHSILGNWSSNSILACFSC